MLNSSERMTFAGIDHQLGWHPKALKSVPELVRLRSWALGVLLSDNDERGCLHLLDVLDGRTLCVYIRTVVDRRAKLRNHPKTDQVLAIVAFPVCDACAGHCCMEAVGIGYCPHHKKA